MHRRILYIYQLLIIRFFSAIPSALWKFKFQSWWAADQPTNRLPCVPLLTSKKEDLDLCQKFISKNCSRSCSTMHCAQLFLLIFNFFGNYSCSLPTTEKPQRSCAACMHAWITPLYHIINASRGILAYHVVSWCYVALLLVVPKTVEKYFYPCMPLERTN